jgi:type IV pilus assembly protein PilB
MGSLNINFFDNSASEKEEEQVPSSDIDLSRLRKLLNMPTGSAEELAQALSKRLRVPFYELAHDFKVESALIRAVPKTLAKRFCIVPVALAPGKNITIAMANPMNVESIDAVSSATGLEVHKAIATEEAIRSAIERFYAEEAFVEESLHDLMEDDDFTIAEFDEGEEDDGSGESQANEAPVVKFVNLVLMTALRDGASDIHFEPGELACRIRLRIDGRLQEIPPPSKSIYNAIVARTKILSGMDISERRIPQDGRFKFKSGTKVIDLRVNTLPEVHGEKVVMRLLDRDSLVVDLADIGFEGQILADLKRILALPHGIILVTGPTGSGKSTTLYGCLSYLNEPETNLQTVEDPVEYQLAGINQCAIRSQVGMTFASALRAILRQDPDVIMVGEIRDKETCEIAMRAALTGHLVLSTLHTNDATSTFRRMMDMGVDDFLISSTVKLVIAQRLIRRLCKCKKEVPPDPDHVRVIQQEFPDADTWTYYEPVGCDICGHRGFKGRAAVHEFLAVNAKISEMIHPDVDDAELRRVSIEEGMPTLQKSGFERVKAGLSTFEEVMRVAAGEH